MKFNVFFLVFFAILISCGEPLARRPKKKGVTNFYKEVLERNKKLNRLEKNRIEAWILKDTAHKYEESSYGYWYFYENKDSLNSYVPKLNDIVNIEYDIKNIDGTIIYDKIKKTYKVDKEDFIPALQEGIKQMKKGDIVTFIIPSYRAFGVSGDGHKIGTNQSIKSTIKLIDIKTNQQ